METYLGQESVHSENNCRFRSNLKRSWTRKCCWMERAVLHCFSGCCLSSHELLVLYCLVCWSLPLFSVLVAVQLKQVTLYQLVKKSEERGTKSLPKAKSSSTPQKTPSKQTPKKSPYRLPPVVARYVDVTWNVDNWSVCFAVFNVVHCPPP